MSFLHASNSKVHIKDKSKLEDKNFYSNLILTLPIRFEVEFKSDFAIINNSDKVILDAYYSRRWYKYAKIPRNCT